MKLILLIAAVAAASAVPVVDKMMIGDNTMMIRQRFIFDILRDIRQPFVIEEYMPYTTTYVTLKDKYINYDEVLNFFKVYDMGVFLPMGQDFTLLDKDMYTQAMLLVDFFMNSIDFDTFMRNVVWARVHINEGMFIYALTYSTLRLDFMQGVTFPAPYRMCSIYLMGIVGIKKITKFDGCMNFYFSGNYIMGDYEYDYDYAMQNPWWMKKQFGMNTKASLLKDKVMPWMTTKNYVGDDYFNMDFMVRDMGKGYYGKDYVYNKDLMYNKDMYNKDYVYNKDLMYNKDLVYNKDYIYNKDLTYNKDLYNNDYYFNKGYYNRDTVLPLEGQDMIYDTKYMNTKYTFPWDRKMIYSRFSYGFPYYFNKYNYPMYGKMY